MEQGKVIRLTGDSNPSEVSIDATPYIMGIDLARDDSKETTTGPSVEAENISLDDAMKLLNIQSQMQDMKDVKNTIKARQLEVIGNQEIVDVLTASIENISVSTLKKMTPEYINDLYILDGKELELDIKIDDEQRAHEFKKDYLIYLKESAKANSEIDAAMAEMDTEMSKNQDEFNSIIAQFGDITACIRAKLQEDYDNADSDEKKTRFGIIIDSFDDAYSLNRLYDHYKGMKLKNTLIDYKDNKISQGLYTKYMAVVKILGLKNDISQFNNLEINFLPEKYHKYPNLFLFSVIKYFAYKKNSVNKSKDGVFLTQFMVNIKNLFANRFTTPEQKQTFIENIQKVLDLYYL